jgi:putative sterol carrier protein
LASLAAAKGGGNLALQEEAMSGQTRTLFERVPHDYKVAGTKGRHATCRIETDDGEQWSLEFDDGQVHVAFGPGRPDPDCTLKGSDGLLARVLGGQQNLLTAALRGDLTVEGDLAAAQPIAEALSVFAPAEGSPS